MYAFISSSKLASFVNTVTTARWRVDRFSARIASWTSSLVGGSGHPQQPPQMIPRTVRECGPVASGSAFGSSLASISAGAYSSLNRSSAGSTTVAGKGPAQA